MAEVQLSTILSAMDVCVSFHTSICNHYPIQAGCPKLTTLSCWMSPKSLLSFIAQYLFTIFSAFPLIKFVNLKS
jgi:hypothetical protein